MSILGLHADSILFDPTVIGATCALSISTGVAWLLKVYLPYKAVGRERLGPGQPVWPLVVAVSLGFMVWLMVQTFYAAWKGGQGPHASSPDFLGQLTAKDWAFLATVPPLAGFITLWITDFAAGGLALLKQIGFTFDRPIRSIARGLIAALVILPPTYALSIGIDALYQKIGFVHPTEHQLLKAMGESQSPAARWILILAATLVAPLFEEFFFRGHIQTLIKKGLTILTNSATQREAGFIAEPLLFASNPVNSPAVSPLALPVPALPYQKPRQDALKSWPTFATIILTSCLFALVHEMWMWPPIFFLSLGLGYCYERTGNLWTSITVHCLFNSVSTFLFFYLPHS